MNNAADRKWTEYVSTPAARKFITIKKEAETYSRTGLVFRAFEGRLPLYMGAETQWELIKQLLSFWPDCDIVTESI